MTHEREPDDTETPSLRAEEGKGSGVPDPRDRMDELSIGAMLRGAIGHEGAPPPDAAEATDEAERRAAEDADERG